MELKIYVHHCYRCNHEWPSRNPKPNFCPKCKSRLWAKPRTKHRRKPIPSEVVQATVRGNTQDSQPEVAPKVDTSLNPIVKIANQLRKQLDE